MKATFRAAALQMCAGHDKAVNLSEAERLVSQAAAQGAELVVLPELFNLCGNLRQVAAAAESLTGPTATMLSRLARQHGIWLVGGSFAEQGPAGKAYNTSLTLDPAGDVCGIYRKMHMFDVDLGPQLRIKESDSLVRGSAITSISTDLAEIGLAICYDLRFPELFRQLSSRGAQLLCVPAAFTKTTGLAHWELLVRARAVENQCYVIAANQVGEHVPGSASYGHSLIVDPWGTILAAAAGEAAEVIVAEISAEVLSEVRQKLPSLCHRIIT
jgi:deaminated glutathione amidase